MNLVIDIGNSTTKIGIFSLDKLILSVTKEVLSFELVSHFFLEYTIKNTIISSVASLPKEEIIAFLQEKCTLIILDESTNLPFENLYKTPTTIGKDRLAAVAGAISLYPNKNLLVVDAGTAITYDFITSEGKFIGGNISPGITMRYKALNHFTKRLPLLSKKDITPLIGQTTDEAIIAGVQNGVINEMEGFINQIHEKYAKSTIIITGGDSDFFVNNVKNPIFVHPNLVLIGLNRILNDNAL